MTPSPHFRMCCGEEALISLVAPSEISRARQGREEAVGRQAVQRSQCVGNNRIAMFLCLLQGEHHLKLSFHASAAMPTHNDTYLTCPTRVSALKAGKRHVLWEKRTLPAPPARQRPRRRRKRAPLHFKGCAAGSALGRLA